MRVKILPGEQVKQALRDSGLSDWAVNLLAEAPSLLVLLQEVKQPGAVEVQTPDQSWSYSIPAGTFEEVPA